VRLLASADLHGYCDVYGWLVEVAATEKPDGVVLAGDLLGWPSGFATMEEAQVADQQEIIPLLSKINCPVFYVMGNDDFIELEATDPALQSANCRRLEFGDYNIVGYQHTLPFMGGIHEKPEHEMKEDFARLEAEIDRATVLVTHGPAYGILDRVSYGHQVGSRSLLRLIERREPRAHIHGHIHGCFGREGRHFNVASAGHKRAMIIDLKTMEHRVVEETTRDML
jgi:Icc-related predicted phosphoesterase